MPIMIDLILGSVVTAMTMVGMRLLLTVIVGDGEMMTLTWFKPLLVQLLLLEMAPPKEPPEVKEYITGSIRREQQGHYNGLCERIWTNRVPPTVVTRLGTRGMSKSKPRTATRSPQELSAKRDLMATKEYPGA
jgi:hypothetical protein